MRRGSAKEHLKGSRRHGGRQWYLSNFLHGRIGRQWNDIYSEICQEFRKGSYARYDLAKWHVRGYYCDVKTDCWIGAETGKLYDSEGVPIEYGFYVHPFTGMLLYKEHVIGPPAPPKPRVHIKLRENICLTKINDIWYYAHTKKNEYYNPYGNHPDEHSRAFYSQEYIITYKRQLSKKQLKIFDLKNGAEDASKAIVA